MKETSEKRVLVRQRRRAIAKEFQHVTGMLDRMRDHTAGHRGPDRMKLVFERRRYAKVSAAAAHSPEEIRIVVMARRERAPVSQDKVGRDEIVQRQPIFAHQPTEPAAESEPGDAG